MICVFEITAFYRRDCEMRLFIIIYIMIRCLQSKAYQYRVGLYAGIHSKCNDVMTALVERKQGYIESHNAIDCQSINYPI